MPKGIDVLKQALCAEPTDYTLANAVAANTKVLHTPADVLAALEGIYATTTWRLEELPNFTGGWWHAVVRTDVKDIMTTADRLSALGWSFSVPLRNAVTSAILVCTLDQSPTSVVPLSPQSLPE